jgi:dipeptidyl aminopeptidase/acylaminoacyl peptidase
MKPFVLISVWGLAFATGPVAAVQSADLLATEPCSATDGDYPQYLERQLATYRQEAAAAAKLGMTMRDEAAARAGLLTRREYAERHGRRSVTCTRLTYRSDGLKVIGFLWRSRRQPKAAQPIIVFNRGGALEDSKLRPNTQFGFYRFVEEGYVVVGSQYRGNDGGEGRDELGGADVNDVLKLVEIARTLEAVDPGNVFALGYSRGAMETLLAAGRGAGFRAAATVGMPADLLQSYLAMPQSDGLYRRLIPDFASAPEAALKSRSALYWTEDIQVPLLLIAGAADPVVPAHANSIRLASRLGELKKTYELVVYDGDTHGVMINARDRDQRILAWFKHFAAKPSGAH